MEAAATWEAGLMDKQARQAFLTHGRHELALTTVNACGWLTRGGGGERGGREGVTLVSEGGACGSCRDADWVPLHLSFEWQLQGS